jgi:hypothetical protein
VLLHQTVIGQEAMAQMELAGAVPDVIVGCVGGGSNFGGLTFPFLRDVLRGSRSMRFVAAEPAACPTLTRGVYSYDYGDTVGLTPLMPMYTLGHDFVPPPVHAGGLRYHGDAPMLCGLVRAGLVEPRAYKQNETFEAAVRFARTEGIIPAPEPAHAIRAVIEEAEAAREGRRGAHDPVRLVRPRELRHGRIRRVSGRHPGGPGVLGGRHGGGAGAAPSGTRDRLTGWAMTRYLIRGAYLLTMEGDGAGDARGGDVAIDGRPHRRRRQRTRRRGRRGHRRPGDDRHAGLVDTHRHMWAAMLRGGACYGTLADYFGTVVFTYGAAFTPDDTYRSVRFGLAESVDGGSRRSTPGSTTSRRQTMRARPVQALRESGMRGRFSYGSSSDPSAGSSFVKGDQTLDLDDILRLREEEFADPNGRLHLGIAARGHEFSRSTSGSRSSRGRASTACPSRLTA